MKTRNLIIIAGIVISSVILILSYGLPSYYQATRSSTLELQFEDEIITVFIRDQTHISTGHTELTTISIENLIKAHDKLPKTNMTDRIIAGSIVSETAKSGTYLTEDGAKEFWYTIDGDKDKIITIELQNHKFDKIVFDSKKNQEVIEQINEMVSSLEKTANDTSDDAYDFVISEALKNNQISSILNGYTYNVECCSVSVNSQNPLLNQQVSLKFHVEEKYLFVAVTYDLKQEKVTAILTGSSDGFTIIPIKE